MVYYSALHWAKKAEKSAEKCEQIQEDLRDSGLDLSDYAKKTDLNTKQDKLTAGTGISISNNVISNTQTSAEWGNIKGTLSNQTDLQNAFNGKVNLNLGNSTAITNCITEIPQDIKLGLNNGTLTLKAGSKYYKCNGSFTEATITVDKVKTSTANGVHFVFINNNGNIEEYFADRFYSGSSQPTVAINTSFWFDTSSNIMKKTTDKGSTWVNNPNMSLPLAIITVSNGAISSIDQVFNGFGYIGSTVFALPNVKGLIPNGRNADGTLKNIEFTMPSVKIYTSQTNYTFSKYGWVCDAAGSIIPYDLTKYEYREDENYNYELYNNEIRKTTLIAYGSVNAGVTTSFTPKLPFRAVDYNDKPEISGWGMPSNRFINLTLGVTGSTYTAPANGYFELSMVAEAVNKFVNLFDTKTAMGVISYVPFEGATCKGWLPVKKGDVIGINYTATGNTNSFRFIYAEGEN